MSLAYEITKRAKDCKQWIHGGEVEKLAMQLGYKASNGGRTARKLEENGVLKKKFNDKGHVLYCHTDNFNLLAQETLL